MPQYRQTDCRSRIRHGGCRNVFRILWRPGEQGDRTCEPGSGKRAQFYVARTDGSRGPDYSMELSVVDGGVEIGAGDRCGLYLRIEAGGTDAVDGVGVCQLF